MISGGARAGAIVLMAVATLGACGDPNTVGEAASQPRDEDQSETLDSTGADDTADTTSEPAVTLRAPLSVERAEVIPDSFWAVTDGDNNLVRIDASSGSVLETLGGWGAAGDADQNLMLTSVAVGGDGRLWLTDCCEPAVGTVYAVDDDQTFDLSEGSDVVDQRLGSAPIISPDGELVAVAQLDQGVAVTVTSDGAEVARADVMASAFTDAVDYDQPVSVVPLTWLGSDVVVLLAVGAEASTMQAVAVTDGEVQAVGQAIRVDGSIVAGAVRTDGNLVVAVGTTAGEPVAGRVIDPDSGDVVAAFDLPADTIAIDYDPTGTFLLAVTADGTASWLGRGQSAQLATGLLSASW